MLNRKHVLNRSLASLQNEAIEKALKAREDAVRWVKSVADENEPYRFNWAKEATREPNAIASVYLVDGLLNMTIKDQLLTPDLMNQGREWVMSMHRGDERFMDPAILAHKPPNWDDDAESWPPTGAHLESMSGACQKLYRHYGGKSRPLGDPPPDWPQLETVETTLDWIKSHNNMSWIGRILTRLMHWYIEGKTDEKALLECLRYVYEQQDKKTGMWGNNIVGTFKITRTIFNSPSIPLFYCDEMIKTHLDLLYSPDYEPDGIFPCTEFDLWYNIGRALHYVDDAPMEEIRKTAAWRIIHILDHYSTDDGSLRSNLDSCIPTWLNVDMAPRKMQSDVFAFSIFSAGILIAADISGISDKIKYKSNWWIRNVDEDEKFQKVPELIKDKLADLMI